MEEIQAKDKLIQDCRNEIDGRDNSLQKHIKEHGSLQKHPKEEAYSRVIRDQYDKAIRLQQDKQKLADRAMYLVCSSHAPIVPTDDAAAGPSLSASGPKDSRPPRRRRYAFRSPSSIFASRLPWQQGCSYIHPEHRSQHASQSTLRKCRWWCP